MLPLPIGTQVAEHGWCSGRVIPLHAIDGLLDYLAHPGVGQRANVGADDWLVIVSQTCDVVASTIEAEPFVEVLHCRIPPGRKVRSQYARFRSTRIIDFKPNYATHNNLVLTAHATADRYLIPRQILAGLDPDAEKRLDEVAVKRLADWYALRSSRPAWPDSFVIRVGEAKDEIEKIIKTFSDELEIRVAIAPRDQELDTDEPYKVAIWFVVDAVAWESDDKIRQAATAAYSQFITALGSCDGVLIDTDHGEVIPGDVFTWQQMGFTDEWNFANLSHVE